MKPAAFSFLFTSACMRILLNGKPRTCSEATTITDLLREAGLPSLSVVVELNRAILQPDSYATILLADNDQVEIIRFVGGG
jgi:thiamine biosynthesis protein ThiS